MTCKDTPPLSAQSHGGVAVAAWRVGEGEEEGSGGEGRVSLRVNGQKKGQKKEEEREDKLVCERANGTRSRRAGGRMRRRGGGCDPHRWRSEDQSFREEN